MTAQVNLTWTDNSTNEDGFNIYRGTSSGSLSQYDTVGADTTSYTDTSVERSQTYFYQVTAYNSNTESDVTSEISVSVPPVAPSDLTATSAGTSAIDLSWTDNSSGEDGFKIYHGTESGNLSSLGTVSADTTSYTHSGLDDDTTHYYQVVSYFDGEESPATAEVSAKTDLSPPVDVTVEPYNIDQLNISWTDEAETEHGFRVYRGTSSGDLSHVATVGENVTSYEDKALDRDTTYYYSISAYKDGEESDLSTEVSETTPESIDSTEIRFNDIAQEKDGYRIHRKPTGSLEFRSTDDELSAPNDPIVASWNNSRELTISIDISLDAVHNDNNWEDILTIADTQEGSVRFERDNARNHGLRWTGATTVDNTNYQLAEFHDITHGEVYTLTVVIDYTNTGYSYSYKNGEQVHSISEPSDVVDWNIGSWVAGYTGWCDYTLHRVSVWDRALDADEVKSYADKNVPQNGLIGYWPIDNGSGTTVEDTVAGNHATISGSPTWVGGGPWETITTVDSRNSVELTSGDSIDFSTTTIDPSSGALAVTFKASDDFSGNYSNRAPIVGGASQKGKWGSNLALRDNDGTGEYGLVGEVTNSNGFYCYGENGLARGETHTAVVSFDGGTATTWVDGVQYDSSAADDTVELTNIGGAVDSPFAGFVEEVVVWDRPLTENEAKDYHRDEPPQAGIVNWWDLNDGTGDTATDVVGSNDGTINGATFQPPISPIEWRDVDIDGTYKYKAEIYTADTSVETMIETVDLAGDEADWRDGATFADEDGVVLTQ